MIEFRTLGGLDLRDSHGRELRAILSAPKRAALLTYLAIATPGGFHRRDTLLALLWPELDHEHARLSLRQALYVIRRAVTNGALASRDKEEVGLDRDTFWCDAVAFEQLLNNGRLEEALALYRGELLEGFHLSGCLEFERWLDNERRRLTDRSAEAACSLAQQAVAEGRTAQVAQWVRRALAFSPSDEGVLQRVIELLDRAGDRAGAMREYEAFAKRLREDYEAEPAPETTALIASVRAREQANGAVLPSAPLAKQPDDAGAASVTTQPRPLWRTRRLAAATLVALGAVTVAGAALIRNSRDAPALDPTRVLVDIFQNETGDPSLDHLGRMATDRVTAGLTVTSFVDVVSLGTRLLSREPLVPDTGLLEQADLQALARANGTGTVVSGSYYLQGDSVHFLTHVTNASTGEELATLEPVVGAIDAPVAAVEQLRDRVMTTLATLTDPRLAKWMRYASQPPTFEAYTEFVEGIELHTHQKPREAIPHFLAAAALDSTFTMAPLWAVFAASFGQHALGDSIGQALNRRRGHLAPLDRLLLDYQLASGRGDHHSALVAMRRFVEIAPGSEFLYKAGAAALNADRPREAVEFLTQADPESGWLRGWIRYWNVLTNAYHRLGDHERELEATRRARQQYPDERRLILREMRAVRRLGDHERELEVARRGRQLHPDEPRMIVAEVHALAALGRVEELRGRIPEVLQRMSPSQSLIGELRAHGYPAAASDLVDRSLEWFESRTSDWKRDTGQSYTYARLLSRVGRWDESQAVLEDLLEVLGPPASGPIMTAHSAQHNNAALQLAYVLARQGHRDQAYRAIGLTRHSANLVVRAWVEAALGERERAVELLRESGFENDMHGLAMTNRWDSLLDYPPFQALIRPKG